ncbi:MAG: hypothetical protein GWN01_03570 [Nitrosopumilaceae archaeon]|nr:hypothetical protein [Nitrosopumilaceae archaeon]NIU00037.1 hypothetical protein [Nitrosopumilaceae archaeon]NIU86415.1 hypothetical protein [Nitrosopumilaceae archaeon]NIV65125.1 hypothetical protein [Nitrosopumilaceae archaeon]NIX60639.1 hypothetical protein [Nitrosopumilaceae archaeon]
MKKILYLIVGVIVFSIIGVAYSYSFSNSPATITYTQMMENMETESMTQMMRQIPEDVIIKVHSSQTVYQDEKAEIVLQVLDKTSNLPLENADVLVGIEKGASMTSMHLQGGMFYADSRANGHYIVSFTPTEKGIYTLHVHVVPEGKSMHSMMQNHLDIGIVSKPTRG